MNKPIRPIKTVIIKLTQSIETFNYIQINEFYQIKFLTSLNTFKPLDHLFDYFKLPIEQSDLLCDLICCRNLFYKLTEY